MSESHNIVIQNFKILSCFKITEVIYETNRYYKITVQNYRHYLQSVVKHVGFTKSLVECLFVMSVSFTIYFGKIFVKLKKR